MNNSRIVHPNSRKVKSKHKYNRQTFPYRLRKNIRKHYQLYLLALPAILVILVFRYIPMYGILLAFKKFSAVNGILGSPWVGLKNFVRFFNSYQSFNIIKNTIGINLYQIAVGFPAPIILALLLNQMEAARYKKMIQTVTYMPHFVSEVVLVGIIYVFFSPRIGPYAAITKLLGGTPANIMGEEGLFKSIFVLSGVWSHTGWNSIIYMAALAGINLELYEAATIDGANRWQKIRYIDIPGIIPTIIILLILRTGNMMDVGFEKVFLMQNSLNISSSEVISTFVYRTGIMQGDYGYSTAIGLFNNIINFALLITVNNISKKYSETTLW